MEPTEIVNQNDQPVQELKTIESKELSQFLFHPTAVIIMLLLDWGGLVLEIPETIAPFTLLLSSVGIFLIAALTTYLLQINLGGDDKKQALSKSLFAGLICAIPYPLMSSVIGATILAMSGFNAIGKQGLGGLIEMFGKREGK